LLRCHGLNNFAVKIVCAACNGGWMSRFDLRLVRQLWERQIPLTVIRNRFPTGFRPPRRLPPRGDTPRTYSLPALLLTRDRGIAFQTPSRSPISLTYAVKLPCALQPVLHPPLWADSPPCPGQPASVQISTFFHAC
jgi:hypothetical protein